MELSNPQLQLLNQYFLNRQDEIVASIRALVETESPSGDEAGSAFVVSMLANSAATIAGVKVEEVPLIIMVSTCA